MKISIIIPVYRVESYLADCIDSVLHQGYPDFELILVDDGSPDRCGEICDEYAARDSRVRVIHKENGGLSSARNIGVAQASGEYIVFLDSDDCWASNTFLYEVADRLAQSHADVLSFNFSKIYADRKDPCYFPEGTKMNTGSLDTMIQSGLWIACAWNKAIRRRLFADYDLHFIEGITSEDIDWCVRLALCAETFDYLDVCGVLYRQRGDSISNDMTVKKVSCLYQNILRSKTLAEAHGGEKAAALQSYLAYQAGTLLQSISQLPRKEDRSAAMKQAKPLLPLLNYSDSAKVKLLRYVCRIAGIRSCVAMLRLRNRLR